MSIYLTLQEQLAITNGLFPLETENQNLKKIVEVRRSLMSKSCGSNTVCFDDLLILAESTYN